MLAWRGGRGLAPDDSVAGIRGRHAVGYRADIDGLRAVAVLPVLLFHAGFPAFGGGFVGVNVFFVISGYLITAHILGDADAGRFSVLDFYARRIRRIFPALFAMLLGTAAIGLGVLLPEDLADLGREVSAATAFASNVLYWRETGYFEAAAGQKLLLHTWSLAVEEQFYVVFPLVMYLVVRASVSRVPFIAAALALSFALAVWGVRHEPAATFYLAPTRAWELLLGALLAAGAFPAPTRQPVRDGLSLLGLALIGWSVLAFSPETRFPGPGALAPCLGAALVIHAGAGGRTSLAGAALGWRPVVFVGLISYSLYLWHWPLLVLAEYVAVRELTAAEALGVLLLSAAVAATSWRFVERPFRERRLLAARPRQFAAAGVASGTALGVGLAFHLTGGLPGRVPPEVARLAATAANHGDKACLRPTTPGAALEEVDLCRLGAAGDARPTFVVWGDSHAWALTDAIGGTAAAAGRTGLVAAHSMCPPLLGVDVGLPPEPLACRAANDSVLDLVTSRDEVDTVLLAARWSLYAAGTAYWREFEGSAYLSDGAAEARSAGSNEVVFRRGLARTVARLAAAGKRVVVVGPVPEVVAEVPSALARSAWFGRPVTAVAPSRGDFDERNRVVLAALDEIGRETPATVVRPHGALCDAAKCRVERDGRVLYFDDNHLSLDGQAVVRPLLHGVFPGRGR